ncbi:Coilin [Raphanus sativus]|nr:Coilin [Raphanus sativus]
MHLKGTTLIGYIRSGAPGKGPTAGDVAFLTKHFGPEAVVDIFSSTTSTGTSTLALYELSKEGFKKTSWTLDEKLSAMFLVPRGDKWNYNTINSSMKNMPYGLRIDYVFYSKRNESYVSK